MKADLRGLDESDLIEFCHRENLPAYRSKQILDWVFHKRVSHVDAMSNLSIPVREALKKNFDFQELTLKTSQGSNDTTQKFLIELRDHQLVETVLIPASMGLYGEKSDRHTLCVSSQVGCAYGCRFCASGLDGFRRNLSSEEIVGQLILVEKLTEKKVHNIVFMGMGEPLANYENVLKAVRILNAPWGLGLGARKITISTSGLVPRIIEMAREKLQIRLAISLHGARDEIRNQIMPVNRKYPISELVQACTTYQKEKGRLITFEYILIQGVNDDPGEAIPLARLARQCHAKVNLIPFNEVQETGFKRPSMDRCKDFQKRLQKQGITVTLRTEKGHDIDAACGQLRLKEIRTQS